MESDPEKNPSKPIAFNWWLPLFGDAWVDSTAFPTDRTSEAVGNKLGDKGEGGCSLFQMIQVILFELIPEFTQNRYISYKTLDTKWYYVHIQVPLNQFDAGMCKD